MKSIYIILFVVLITLNTRLHGGNPQLAHKPDLLEEARIRAAKEGRLLIADFYAQWCTPCQWMEKNTYPNQSVSDLIHQSFIRVKVDIDQPEGYNLKQVFDIKYLPTLLIFNSEGKLIDRIEETLSPSNMITTLLKHDITQNKSIIKHHLNIAPALHYSEKFISESMHQRADEYKKHFLVKQTSKMFRVQVGVFTTYLQAEQMVNSLTKMTDAPVSVIVEYKDGVPEFKVSLGQFDVAEDADVYKIKLLNEHKLDGIVI